MERGWDIGHSTNFTNKRGTMVLASVCVPIAATHTALFSTFCGVTR